MEILFQIFQICNRCLLQLLSHKSMYVNDGVPNVHHYFQCMKMFFLSFARLYLRLKKTLLLLFNRPYSHIDHLSLSLSSGWEAQTLLSKEKSYCCVPGGESYKHGNMTSRYLFTTSWLISSQKDKTEGQWTTFQDKTTHCLIIPWYCSSIAVHLHSVITSL